MGSSAQTVRGGSDGNGHGDAGHPVSNRKMVSLLCAGAGTGSRRRWEATLGAATLGVATLGAATLLLAPGGDS